MTARFAEEWAAASGNIDEFFGEAFFYTPFAHVGGKYVVDPDRAVISITAALDDDATLTDPIGQRNAAGMSKGIVSQIGSTSAMINIATNALPYPPRIKDRIMRISTGEVFEISAVLQDRFARIDLRVVSLGAA